MKQKYLLTSSFFYWRGRKRKAICQRSVLSYLEVVGETVL